ncbi:MAG TPA: hypothetical protein VKV04_08180 [Verrucomicrobiae bacterium]|nr:hypothetical protein [Verrucomicrobiae bacterium]
MNLYFQFFTHEESKAAIDLIRIPTMLIPDQQTGGSVRMSAAGVVSRYKYTDVEHLLSKMRESRLNEAEVIYDFKQIQIAGLKTRAKKINGVLRPSVTSEMWFPSKEFPHGDRASLSRRMNAKAKEQGLSEYSVHVEPSLFEVVFDVDMPNSEEQSLDACSEWLAHTVSQKLEELNVFGCCDVGDKRFVVGFEYGNPWLYKIRAMDKLLPASYPEMGRRFDDLHPLMFGAKQLCSHIAEAVGGGAKLICGPNGSDFAAIRLNPKCDIAVVRERAKEWLLPSIR